MAKSRRPTRKYVRRWLSKRLRVPLYQLTNGHVLGSDQLFVVKWAALFKFRRELTFKGGVPINVGIILRRLAA